MKNSRKIFLLTLTLLIMDAKKTFSASGTVIENDKYTLFLAQKDEKNEVNIENKTLNSVIIAANGGENVLNFKNTTFETKDTEDTISIKGYGFSKISKKSTGSVLISDQSYEGKNEITFENVTINNHYAGSAIQTFDQSNAKKPELSEAKITFKGVNTFKTLLDSDKLTGSDKNRTRVIQLFNNSTKIGNYNIVSEEGSTLNLYSVSGPINSGALSINHYNNTSGATKIDPNYPTRTVMDFKGDVNIKVDRNGQLDAENYGVGISARASKRNRITIPDDSKAEITFRGNVDIDVTPVYDEKGNPKSIGDAISVDGKNSKVEIIGGIDKIVKIKGDIHAFNEGIVNVNLANKDSYFEGEAHIGKMKYTSKQDLFDETRDENDELIPTKSEIDNIKKRIENWKKSLTRPKISEKAKENLKKQIANAENEIERYKKYIDLETGIIKNEAIDNTKNAINLNISNGAKWKVIKDSMIKNLDLSKGGTVTFSGNNGYANISMSKLKGEAGIFEMDGDVTTGKSDLITVRKESEGTHIIKFKDNAGGQPTRKEYLKLVENLSDPEHNKAIYKVKGSGIEVGPYEYKLGEAQDSKLVKIAPDGKHDYYIHPTNDLTAGAQSAMILSNLLYQLNALNVDTLVQRMGEVHFDKAKTDYNIWSRYINGKYSGFEDLQDENYKIPYWGSKVKNVRFEKVATKNNNIWVKNMEGQFTGFKNERTGSHSNRYRITKVGFDFERLRDNWINYGGVVFSNINSHTKFLSYEGKNEIKGMSLGLYSTWLHKEKNIYYDFVANITNYKSRYDVISASGDPVHSLSPESSDDFIHTNSFTFSAETGKRILLKEEKDKTYYVQPEGQLVYQFTKGYKFNVSNGLRVNNGDLHGLLTRVGLRAGIDSKNKRFNSYVKLMYEAELLGNSKTVFNEKFDEYTSNRDHWLTYGIGLTTTTKKGKQIYFEAQRSTKHKVRQDWQLNLGIRFNFK